MGRKLIFLYGVISYFVFFTTFLYMIGFVGGIFVPKGINSGVAASVSKALFINLFFILLFGIQHTIMARIKFKNWFTKLIPKPMERSTYVLLASLILIALVWQWRPMNRVIWSVGNPIGNTFLWILFFSGWIMVLYSTFIINHFDLFGLRQVYFYLKGKEYTPVPLVVKSFYHFCRHPIMLGFIIAFWATPFMTLGHLVFAIMTTLYILFGIHVEERTLMKILGDQYRHYRQQVSMIFPIPKFPKQKSSEKALSH